MKALSIKQPWAWAIIHSGKDIENRSWKTNFRGRIYIHCSKKIDKKANSFLNTIGMIFPNTFLMGGIIGSIEIVDCVTESKSKWFFGPFGFVLKNPIALPFKPCFGKLGFFDVDYNNI